MTSEKPTNNDAQANLPSWHEMLLLESALLPSYLVEDTRGNWNCICGNSPDNEGFLMADSSGRTLEGIMWLWDCKTYVCDRCGRIIDGDTLEVVGRAHWEIMDSNLCASSDFF